MAKGAEYWEKLGKAYEKNGLQAQWEHLTTIAEGISQEDRAALLAEYPDVPPSLMEILARIDGTYYRQYGDENVACFFFGSDVDDGAYPYYLLSARNILEDRDCRENFYDLIYCALNEPDERYGPFFDRRIKTEEKCRLLHFSDCVNNGGTSSLYIDFAPSESGKKGQIVRYLHDPDELKVIADSFDEFLDMLMERDFAFIQPDAAKWFF